MGYKLADVSLSLSQFSQSCLLYRSCGGNSVETGSVFVNGRNVQIIELCIYKRLLLLLFLSFLLYRITVIMLIVILGGFSAM